MARIGTADREHSGHYLTAVASVTVIVAGMAWFSQNRTLAAAAAAMGLYALHLLSIRFLLDNQARQRKLLDAQWEVLQRFIGDADSDDVDEIGDLSLGSQAKLLRVIEEKVLLRVGGSAPIHTDARVLAATNRDPEMSLRDGKLRQDLFYRLNVISIHVPPLRERKVDIPLLIDVFIRRNCLELNKEPVKIAPSALKLLMDYDWPGNVRELENVIERALVIGRDKEIVPADLPFSRKQLGLEAFPKSLKMMEKMHIKRMLEETNWNITQSARELEIDRQTLYNKIEKYKIER